jgi:hypothetical protein
LRKERGVFSPCSSTEERQAVRNLRVGGGADTSVEKKGKKEASQTVGRDHLIVYQRTSLTVE